MILYVNSCVRSDSRTDRLAKAVLDKLGEYTEIYLPDEDLKPLSADTLNKRTELLEQQRYDDPMLRYARQFAEADKIVISAPYWDASFPSLLKVYLENIYAVGIVSKFDSEGNPVGLCKADELIYVTTAGGKFFPYFGYDYVRTLSEKCFGISKTRLIKAEMLDIAGIDPEKIMSEAIVKIQNMEI